MSGLKLPECHVRVDPSMGYDLREPQCRDCAAKITCLPETIDIGNIRVGIEVDPEVAALQRKILTVEQVHARIRARQSLLDNSKPIPAELSVEASLARPKRKRSDRRRKAPHSVRTSKGVIEVEAPRRYYQSGRALPKQRQIDLAGMQEILDRLNLQARSGGKRRLPFDLDIGMILISHQRARSIEIRITSKGFEWEGEVYTSLSTACCHALKRSVSGLDLFDLTKRRNCEIVGGGVPGGRFSYQEWHERQGR